VHAVCQTVRMRNRLFADVVRKEKGDIHWGEMPCGVMNRRILALCCYMYTLLSVLFVNYLVEDKRGSS